MTISMFLTRINAALLSGQSFQIGNAISNLPLNYSLGLVFETIFVVFGYPLLRENTEQSVAIPVTENDSVLIAGKTSVRGYTFCAISGPLRRSYDSG